MMLLSTVLYIIGITLLASFARADENGDKLSCLAMKKKLEDDNSKNSEAAFKLFSRTGCDESGYFYETSSWGIKFEVVGACGCSNNFYAWYGSGDWPVASYAIWTREDEYTYTTNFYSDEDCTGKVLPGM